jgi:hypothetical protein
MTAQSGLDVTNRNPAIVSSKGRSKSGGGVALYQHHMGLKAVARIFDRVQDASGKRVERLVRAHNIQVEVGLDLEVLENVVKHRPMLASVYHRGLKLF